MWSTGKGGVELTRRAHANAHPQPCPNESRQGSFARFQLSTAAADLSSDSQGITIHRPIVYGSVARLLTPNERAIGRDETRQSSTPIRALVSSSTDNSLPQYRHTYVDDLCAVCDCSPAVVEQPAERPVGGRRAPAGRGGRPELLHQEGHHQAPREFPKPCTK